MTKLSVNLNKVALLRNQRHVGYPSVIEAARLVVNAGAHGITVHPRPDGRHIRLIDVRDLAGLMVGEFGSSVEFNIEGNPFEEVFQIVEEVRPTQATLVPDAPTAATSDSGWDLVRYGDVLQPVIASLKRMGIRVSLFVDPIPAVIRYAKQLGADRIELYTGPYAAAFETPQRDAVVHAYVLAAQTARSSGLGVNAGHDLTMANARFLCAMMPWLEEVSIGHALTADALWMGYDAAVKGYLAALSGAPWP